MEHAFNPSTQEAEQFKASLERKLQETEKPCLEKTKQIKYAVVVQSIYIVQAGLGFIIFLHEPPEY